MTDQDIEAAAKKFGGRWKNGSYWVFEDADLHTFARALLAVERERCLHLARYALSCARNIEWAAAEDAVDRIGRA